MQGLRLGSEPQRECFIQAPKFSSINDTAALRGTGEKLPEPGGSSEPQASMFWPYKSRTVVTPALLLPGAHPWS